MTNCEVWVFSENRNLMLELLGKGRQLADKLQTKLTAILLGKNAKNQAQQLIQHGADKILLMDNPKLEKFRLEPYLSVLTELAARRKPEIILIGSTCNGKELASRLAVRLETGCVPDCTELNINENGQLTMKRIVYGGNAVAKMMCKTKPEIVTVPPRVFEKLEPKEKTGEITEVDVKIEEPKTEIVETKEVEARKVALEEANVIISGGRGVKNKEDFEMFNQLAETLRGQIGNSRPIAEDRRWFTDWIGLSGRKVTPSLYVACGISGMIQHVAGIRDSQVIVAVNKDPEAPIFEVADYIVVGDLYDIIPALTSELKKILKDG
ncbi:MAG: electron transfer flavoprotein subunit alpha/FixB family protein [Thermoproteota archaeon]|nr:electron transfer flavoprotein subunit alpha/FixB family protein [Thermoproteota archaeon]